MQLSSGGHCVFANFTDLSTINTKHSTITVHCYAALTASLNTHHSQLFPSLFRASLQRWRIKKCKNIRKIFVSVLWNAYLRTEVWTFLSQYAHTLPIGNYNVGQKIRSAPYLYIRRDSGLNW